jgi:hypothetical protein
MQRTFTVTWSVSALTGSMPWRGQGGNKETYKVAICLCGGDDTHGTAADTELLPLPPPANPLPPPANPLPPPVNPLLPPANPLPPPANPLPHPANPSVA